jgi:hypothetical protein
MADTLTLIFNAVNNATPAIKEIDTELAKLGKTSANVAKLTAGVLAAGAAALAVELTFAAKAAMGAEDSLQTLNNALRNTGQASAENSKALAAQAEQLQKTTKYSDDQISSLQALAINMGASADEARRIVDAGTNMATALGIDAEQAVKGLAVSLSGTAGTLGKLNPAFRSLSDEALKNGEAIKMAASQYAGFSAGAGQTFGGSLARIGNAFDDIQESIGAAFTENEQLKGGMDGLIPILGDLQKLVLDNKDTLIDLATFGFIGALQAFNGFMQGVVVGTSVLIDLGIILDNLSGIIDMPELPELKKRFEGFGTEVFVVSDKLTELTERLQSGKGALGAHAGATDKATAGQIRFDDELLVGNTNAKMQAEALKLAADRAKEYAKNMAEFSSQRAANEFDFALTGLTADDFAELEKYYKTKEIFETELSAYKKRLDDERLQTEADAKKKQAEADAKAKESADASAPALKSLAGGDVIGAAKGALSMAGPWGAVAGLVLDLTQKTREQMDEFFQGIADTLTNFVENLDDVFMSFIGKADEIFLALATGLGNMMVEMLASLPEILGGIITGLVDSIGGMITGFVDTISGIGDAIAGWFEKDKAEKEQSADEKYRSLTGLYKAGYMTDAQYAAAVDKLRAEEAKKIEDAAKAQQYAGQTSLSGLAYNEQQRAAAEEYTRNMYANETGETRDQWGRIVPSSNQWQARADGGMVLPSQKYIVGERGPEMFVPASAGMIVPNQSGGANVTINVAVTTNNGMDVVNKLKAAFRSAEMIGAIPRNANPFNFNPVTSAA